MRKDKRPFAYLKNHTFARQPNELLVCSYIETFEARESGTVPLQESVYLTRSYGINLKTSSRQGSFSHITWNLVIKSSNCMDFRYFQNYEPGPSLVILWPVQKSSIVLELSWRMLSIDG